MSCHALLQGIFLSQGSNPCCLCVLLVLEHKCHLGKPPRGLVHPCYVGPDIFRGWGQGEDPALPWGASAWCLSTVVSMPFCNSEPSTAPTGLGVKLQILLWSLHTVPPSPPCPLCLLLSLQPLVSPGLWQLLLILRLHRALPPCVLTGPSPCR